MRAKAGFAEQRGSSCCRKGETKLRKIEVFVLIHFSAKSAGLLICSNHLYHCLKLKRFDLVLVYMRSVKVVLSFVNAAINSNIGA